MEGRIVTAPTQHAPDRRFFEVSFHHNQLSDWEWLIDTAAAPPADSPRLVSVCGTATPLHNVPNNFHTLTEHWTTLDAPMTEWVREQLLDPIVRQPEILTPDLT